MIESSMSRPPLPLPWVSKIFSIFQGNYGTQVLDKFRTGERTESGGDAGIENALAQWADGLAGFAADPNALKRALENLPRLPPSLPEFRDLCRCYATRGTLQQALPAPDVTPRQAAERQAQIEQALSGRPGAIPGREWAHKLRAQWLAGHVLAFQQIRCASEALGEVWEGEGGRRTCRPVQALAA